MLRSKAEVTAGGGRERFGRSDVVVEKGTEVAVAVYAAIRSIGALSTAAVAA
jgi:hypothetical protein